MQSGQKAGGQGWLAGAGGVDGVDLGGDSVPVNLMRQFDQGVAHVDDLGEL